MKICFYSPYLPNHFGGGEKHLFDVAIAAAQYHQVVIALSEKVIPTDMTLLQVKQEYETFIDSSLDSLEFISTPLGSDRSFIHKILWTHQFDAIYYVTDGSLFFSLARNNHLHVQVPFLGKKNSFIERLKLNNWQHINTNSEFTKHVIEKEWNVNVATVLHPMVDVEKYSTDKSKAKIILSVGRFFRQLHSKRQDVLVQIFKQLVARFPTALENWKLVLAGSVEDDDYVKEIKAAANGLPVTVVTNVSGSQLLELYKSASVYWHAAGFEVDETIHPEKVEHFGISTVEAMAAGVVPLVHYKGGQKEILGNELAVCGWLSVEDCMKLTLSVLTDKKRFKTLSEKAVNRAKNFSKTLFEKKVHKLFSYDK